MDGMTFAHAIRMSALGQKRNSCTATKSPSLNHIVCSGQHYFWYGNTKGFGGLEINV